MQSVINIVFRGLLVFNQIGGGTSGEPAMMEIGILPADKHYARILTKKDGNHVDTKCLFPRPDNESDCLFDGVPTTQQVYQIKADDPVSLGITLKEIEGISEIVRTNLTKDNEEDFRWILHLKNTKEFPSHTKVDGNLDYSQLKIIIRVPVGQFYTAAQPLTSLDLVSKRSGASKKFGYFAAIIGCRIAVKSGDAGLYGTIKNNAGQYEVDPKKLIFSFSSNPRYSYEIANSPSDTYNKPGDHFHHYYDLFIEKPSETYYFKTSDAKEKGPNPALCGQTYLGQSGGSLTTNLTTATRSVQPTKGKRRRIGKSRSGRKHRQH
jgi:hypothetical protein